MAEVPLAPPEVAALLRAAMTTLTAELGALPERLAALATRAGVEGRHALRIRTPLIRLTKAEIIRAGVAAGVDYALTLSCYDPSPDGAACGRCDACALRRKGFVEAGVPDPTRYRAG